MRIDPNVVPILLGALLLLVDSASLANDTTIQLGAGDDFVVQALSVLAAQGLRGETTGRRASQSFGVNRSS